VRCAAQNPKPRPRASTGGRFTDTNSPTVCVIAMRSSRHASAPPAEEQRDYEQHKEYKEQDFRNARRCSGNTAKPKNRCYKRDD